LGEVEYEKHCSSCCIVIMTKVAEKSLQRIFNDLFVGRGGRESYCENCPRCRPSSPIPGGRAGAAREAMPAPRVSQTSLPPPPPSRRGRGGGSDRFAAPRTSGTGTAASAPAGGRGWRTRSQPWRARKGMARGGGVATRRAGRRGASSPGGGGRPGRRGREAAVRGGGRSAAVPAMAVDALHPLPDCVQETDRRGPERPPLPLISHPHHPPALPSTASSPPLSC